MNINEKLRQRRLELGLTPEQVAKAAGITLAAYEDIEDYSNEIFELVPLAQIKRILSFLGLDLLEVFEIRCPFCVDNKKFVDEFQRPRNELLKLAREVHGLSRPDLARRTGFTQFEIETETDANRLEQWRLEMIEELSKTLDIPIQLLLSVKCKKCGR